MAEAAATPAPAEGTAEAATAKLAESDVKPSLLNEKVVDVEDDESERTIDKPEDDEAKGEKKEGEETAKPLDLDALKLPEGVEKNEEVWKEFGEVAAKHGLSQEAAQAVIDLHGKTLQKVADQPYQKWRDTQDNWQAEVRKDGELGGKNFDVMRRTISKAFDEYGDPKVREALDFTGAGNNPAVIRTFYRMAKALTEGGPVPAPAPGKPMPTAAEAMYPHLAEKKEE